MKLANNLQISKSLQIYKNSQNLHKYCDAFKNNIRFQKIYAYLAENLHDCKDYVKFAQLL